MTIAADTNRATFDGDDVTVALPFNYKFTNSSDLKVVQLNTSTLAETTLILDTDYTVSGAGNDNGGTVTLTTAAAAGITTIIERNANIVQDTDLVSAGRYPAQDIENSLDRITAYCIQLKSQLSRAMKTAFGDNADLELPFTANRIGKILGFDSSGNPAVSSSTLEEFDNLVSSNLSLNESANTITVSTITPPTDADYTLDSTEYSHQLVLDLSNWTESRNIVVPDSKRQYYIDNKSNNLNATIKTSGGVGVTIKGRTSDIVTCDTTDCLEYPSKINDNEILNPDFYLAQDDSGSGVSISGAEVYHADQWLSDQDSGTTTVSQETFTPGQDDVEGEPIHYCQVARTGAESAQNKVLYTRLEGVDRHAGEEVVFSGYFQCDTEKTFTFFINQNFGSGGSSEVEVVATSVVVPTGFSRLFITATMNSIAGKTVGTSSYIEMGLREDSGFETFTLKASNTKFELGRVPTPFRKPISRRNQLTELYAFYLKVSAITGAGTRIDIGQAFSTTQVAVALKFPLRMRVKPTIAFSGATEFTVGLALIPTTAVGAALISPDTASLSVTVGSAVLTAGNAMLFAFSSTGSPFYTLDARL